MKDKIILSLLSFIAGLLLMTIVCLIYEINKPIVESEKIIPVEVCGIVENM